MSDTSRVIALAFGLLLIVCAWMSIRAARAAVSSPERLVAELRLAQLIASLLIFVAGAYVGVAAANADRPGVGLDVALALGFFVVAGTAVIRDPREALTILALAFVAHALVDILHRPGALPDGIVPRRYMVGGAIYDLCIAGLCYLPMLKR